MRRIGSFIGREVRPKHTHKIQKKHLVLIGESVDIFSVLTGCRHNCVTSLQLYGLPFATPDGLITHCLLTGH
jgi:hypothetical protein